MKRRVIWSKTALNQFAKAIEFIREDSPQNADSVKERILAAVATLENTTVEHRKDPYRLSNDGSFYYFELLKYRISYRLTENTVLIVRLRHTSIKPKNY